MAPAKVSNKKSSTRASAPSKLLLRIANERSNPLEVCDDFNEKNKTIERSTDSGLKLCISCHVWDNLDEEKRTFMVDLTEKNMENLYVNSAWGWNRQSKISEFKNKAARHLLVFDTEQPQQPIACVHFRFEEGYAEDASLYCYELQVHPDYHRKGIGKCLMNLLAELARKNRMKKILITVLKENVAAREFYTKTLDFVTDKHSPDRCGETTDYEILMQRIDSATQK